MNRLQFYTPVTLFKKAVLFVMMGIIGISFNGQAQVPENEPNNSFATADAIAEGTVKTATVLSGSDPDDYFSTQLGSDGTVKIYVQATNTGGGAGYLYLYAYDARQGNGQVLAKYVANNGNVVPGQTIYDTIYLYGRGAENFFFRFQAGGSISYSFKYAIDDLSLNDTEPNNTYDQSLSIARHEEKMGHIGYLKSGASDGDDFYKTILPVDGTLRIFVKATNQSGGNGFAYIYGYDARKGNGQVLAKYIANNANVAAGATVYDTINLYGRAMDSFYFRMQSGGAFSYNLSYNLLDSTANDIEPNNFFETALPIAISQQAKGHIGYLKNGGSDGDDFYKTLLPTDGKLKIIVTGLNQSGNSGYLYIYGYDTRKGNGQALARYIGNNANVLAGETISDTIYLYGRAADSFYFRIQSGGAFSYSLQYEIIEGDVNDVEPNNTFEEPVPILAGEEKKGHIGYVKNGGPDGDDFYKTVVPIDGTLKIYIKGTNQSGGNGYLYLYGYDKRKGNGQIFATYISGSANVAYQQAITDTITVYGILSDTFYFRFQSGGAFDYSLKYEAVPNSQLDQEPNNTFDEAIEVRQGVVKNGQVGYQLGGVRDSYDYYKTFLPTDGAMKIIVEGTNNSGGTGFLYLYGYDKRQGNGQVLAKYIANNANVNAGSTVNDTIYLFGRAADSFYFRFESGGAFSYNFSYDIIDTSQNDLEPNNTFVDALVINRLERKRGHIGYVKNGGSDGDDFYKAILPEDGTLKIYMTGINQSGTNAYIYLYAYDARNGNGQIYANYIANNANVGFKDNVVDTISLYGRAADTVYFRVQSGGAFSYTLEYDMQETSENDAEPNNSFEQAIIIAQSETKKGHIGYVMRGGSDADDFYTTVLPRAGSLKIYIQGTNRSAGAGYLYIYGYDNRKGNGQVLAKYIANNANVPAGSTVNDSITLFGRDADTFYFRIQSGGAFVYSFNYDITDTTVNDPEPNNSFEQALAIDPLEVRKGLIGYVKNGSADSDDFYVTKLPRDGTLKIYVQGINQSAGIGYLYIYGYDRRKGNGQVLANYIRSNANVAAGETIYDTIYLNCRAADTFYYRIQSGGAFSYQLKYEMTATSDGDTEPNNTIETATPLTLNTDTKGHIGYLQNGGSDTDDFYKTEVPGNGNLRIIVEATNTSGGNGFLYLYGYDNRGLNGQLLARYLKNNTNVSPGETIRDTITLNCYFASIFYARVQSSGCFSYRLKVEFDDKRPKAVFDYTRVGDLFGFSINSAANAENFKWDLANGTTTTKHEPSLTTYVPGFYEVKLIATNTSSGCSFSDTAVKSFTVKGIDRYTPNTGGQGIVDMAIYGGGLTAGSTLKLTQAGTIISATKIQVSPNGNIYVAQFDLHNATPGIYDVDIITPDSTYHYPNGFVLQSGRVDKLRVEIVGRGSVRENVDYYYTARVHNEGNTNAGIVEVYMLTSPWYEIKDLDSIISPVTVPEANSDTLPHVIPVTAAMGFPSDGNFRGYFVEGIPPGGYRDIRITIKFLPHATVGNIYVWAKGPYSGSPWFDWVDGCWKARLRRAFTYGNIGLNKIPVVDCGWNVVKTLAIPITAAYTGISSGWDVAAFFGSAGKTAFNMIKHCAAEAAAATGVGAVAAPEIEIAADLSDIPFDTYDIIQMEQYQQEVCPDKPEKDKRKPDNRTSLDPNEITGPEGYGFNKYISGNNKLMNYGVFFENMAIATAPAQTVVVYDTLDKNVFDLSTFKIGSFGIGINSYSASLTTQEYVTQINLNNDIAVRASLKLDTATGVLKTTFKTIDLVTGDLTTDPLAGFLPPNVNAPEGDGFFTYSLELKDGLPTGTKINNKASIIFDNNAPIETNVWSNTIDRDNPTSGIKSVTAISDTVALIIPQGTDATSGVEQFRLYMSAEGAPYISIANLTDSVKVQGLPGKTYNFYVIAIDSVGNEENKIASVEGSITFPGSLPVTMLPLKAVKDGLLNRLVWSTLTEAKNNGFNIERSEDGRNFAVVGFVKSKAINGISTASISYIFVDATAPKKAYYRLKQTDIDGRISYSNIVWLDRNKAMNISVYPNPATSQIFVSADVQLTGLQLTDVSGRPVKQFAPTADNRYNIAGLPNGVYVLKIIGKDTSEQVKLIIRTN